MISIAGQENSLLIGKEVRDSGIISPEEFGDTGYYPKFWEVIVRLAISKLPWE